MTAIAGLRQRSADLISRWSSTGCDDTRPHAPSSQQPPSPIGATINPSYCWLLVAALLAPKRITLPHAHLPHQPNFHGECAVPSALHRPRVRSAAAFGRRPSRSWRHHHRRRPNPAQEETLAPQQAALLFNHLVGAHE